MKPGTNEAGSRRLIGRASIVAAGTMYQQGIAFVSGLIVARVIGAADYGVFSLARNLVDVTAIFTRLGLDIGLQRHFGETSSAQHRGARLAVLRRLRLLAAALALVPVLAVALGLGGFLEVNVYRHDQFAEILLCLALALPFMTDLAVLGGAYRGILKLSPSVIAEAVLLPTIRLAVIIALFLAGWRLWAVAVGTTLGSFLASAYLAVRARADFGDGAAAGPRSWSEPVRVLRYSGVLAGAMLVTTLTNSMDLLTLGRFAPAQDLGQYSLMKTLLVLMGVFGAAFTQGLGALVAERHSRGDLAGLVRVMSLSTRLIALATVPVFATFLFWGAQIAQLFGPSFAMSQTVVAWLATGQFIFMMFGPCGWALSMTGRHLLELKILSVGLVVATLGCWIAVPALGQLGAAVATCAAMATANVARVLFVRRAIGAFPFGGDILVIALTGIGLAWGCSQLVAQFSLAPLWSALAGIGAFALAYGVALWTGLLRDSERAGIHGALGTTARILFSRGA